MISDTVARGLQPRSVPELAPDLLVRRRNGCGVAERRRRGTAPDRTRRGDAAAVLLGWATVAAAFPDPVYLRDLLDGRSGPYADPRYAVDALDDVKVLVGELDPAGRAALGRGLTTLVLNPERHIATAAALALDVVGDDLDLPQLVEWLGTAEATALNEPPEGFPAASRPTLRAEVVVVVCRLARPDLADHATALAAVDGWIEHPPGGMTRGEVLFLVADRWGDQIVHRAPRWLTTDDTGVLVRLPSHWHRLAAAGALRPWPDAAEAAVRTAAGMRAWEPAELDALLRAMADEAPQLCRPPGIDDQRRWRMTRERPWDWTLWEADDGTRALEVVCGSVGVYTVTEVLSPEDGNRLDAATAAEVTAHARSIEARR